MRWFDKQSYAIQHCAGKDGNEHGVFVLHKFNGTRRFCVATYDEFTKSYLSYPLELCHYYEVIREGVPSKLFMDIDISNAEYVGSKGSLLVEILIRYISHCLLTFYGIQCNRCDILQLDSSNETKFSQHLVYPQVVFKSCLECGNFMKKISYAAIDELQSKEPSQTIFGFPATDLVQLFYDSGTKPKQFVVDLGVYTRNRHFRLLRSSKLEKREHLVAAEANQYPIHSEEQFFLDSLITHTMATSFAHQFLTCEPPILKKSTEENNATATDAPPSPPFRHTDLIDFVLSCIRATEQHKNTTIHSSVHAQSGICVAYTLDGPKWCENVKREHSNNHPYFVANLRTGKVYQKCFSAHCKLYRSPAFDIPLHIWGRFHLGDEDMLMQQLLDSDTAMVELAEEFLS